MVLQNRRSIRLSTYDYSRPGYYYVTICTQYMKHLFGNIENGTMMLNTAGKIANKCWKEIPKHFPQVSLDKYIIMPNHIHGIIIINYVRAKNFSPVPIFSCTHNHPKTRPKGTSKSLGSIIRGFKIGVTQWYRQNTPDIRIWHRSFYDRIIRSEPELHNIREYIINNPINWANDEYNF